MRAQMGWRLGGRALLCATLLAPLAYSWAAPAPWYWWASRLNGQRWCAQHLPPAGWVRGAGPFDNAQCQPARSSLLHGVRVPTPVRAAPSTPNMPRAPQKPVAPTAPLQSTTPAVGAMPALPALPQR